MEITTIFLNTLFIFFYLNFSSTSSCQKYLPMNGFSNVGIFNNLFLVSCHLQKKSENIFQKGAVKVILHLDSTTKKEQNQIFEIESPMVFGFALSCENQESYIFSKYFSIERLKMYFFATWGFQVCLPFCKELLSEKAEQLFLNFPCIF